MSNSDNELPQRQGEDGPAAGEEQRPKKTLLGMGFKLPSPGSIPAPRPAPEPEDFEAEATQMAHGLMGAVLEDFDSEMDAAFGVKRELPEIPIESVVPLEPEPEQDDADVAPEEEFTAEATQIAESELQFPEDVPEAELGGLQSDSLPAPIRRGGPPLGGLAEDSLPDPINAPVPTFQASPPSDWRSSVPADLLTSSAPLPEEDDLPAPIREPAAYRGDPDQGQTEFPAEKTELINSPFEQDPSVAKLITLDGPLVGQEFFAAGLRNTIGRGLNNSIVVGDLAMSRQHFEIAKNPDETFTLRDLQSINGTMLNGTRVREADLFHGDRLEAGKSTFQFVVTGTPPAASRQRRLVPAATATMSGQTIAAPAAARPVATGGMNRMLIPLSLAALAVSLLIIAGLALMVLKKPAPGASASTTEPPASQIYLEGVAAVKSQDWDLAETKFTTAGGKDPSLAGIPEQLRRIERERAAQKSLATARELAEEGRLEEAKDHVEAIGSDSVYFTEARELVRETRTTEVERLYAEAQAALTEDDSARADELASQILALVPTHQGAQKIRSRIDSLERAADEIEEQEAAEAAVATRTKRDDFTFELIGTQKSASQPRRASGSQKTSAAASGSARVPNFTQGFVLYRTRKFDQAQQFFEDAASEESPAASLASKLAGQIADFKASYEQGNKAYAGKNWAEADRKLLAAKRADSAISSNAGQFHVELSAKLASVKSNLGLAALGSKDAVQARRFLDQAESFDRDASDTKQLRAALEKEATALYVQAVNMRKSDPGAAAKLCRTIMKIVPRSDDTHQKADKLLKSL